MADQNETETRNKEEVTDYCEVSRQPLDACHIKEKSSDERFKGHGKSWYDGIWEHASDHDEGDNLAQGEHDGHVHEACEMLVGEEAPDSEERVEAPVASVDEVAGEGHVDAVENVDDEH